MVKKYKFDNDDLEYMESLSAAVLQTSVSSSRVILWIAVLLVAWFIVWASFSKIDERTSGEGKVVPSSQIQVVQNLEGGIISEILTKEGDKVKKGDILLKIDNKKFLSDFGQNEIKLYELQAKALRLKAQSTGKPFKASKELKEKIPAFIEGEYSLFKSAKNQLISKLKALNEELLQKKNELEEAKNKIELYNHNLDLLEREIKMTKPLVKQGVHSEVDFLKLKREKNDLIDKLESVKHDIVRLKSEIKEQKNKMVEAKLEFQNKAKEELNKTIAEIERVKKSIAPVEDQVKRTLVKSPVDGTINRLYVNTVGGVIKPGMDIAEIVPSHDTLLVEVKIKPSDIAFIHPGQKALVKFTAYDFSIYGGLDGEVVWISADTITDKKENSYYLVRIKTDRNYLGDENKKLMIIPGMIVTAQILTGKKTIMDYLLKPILKAKNNALTER
jgi:adhesin transport system membrane fusion protein